MTEQCVYIVDDDEAMRDSLQWLIESQGLAVRTFAAAEDFLAACGDAMAGCIVLDVRMPGMSGLELYEKMNLRRCTLPVIFITGHGDVPMAVSALKKGAVDFIEKPFNDKELLRVIGQCLERERATRQQRQREGEGGGRLAGLTEREREVTDLILAGKLNKQIADVLNISIKTVEVHRARIMDKMGVRSVAELVQAVLPHRP
jgi:FixJ family two-component response regulator